VKWGVLTAERRAVGEDARKVFHANVAWIPEKQVYKWVRLRLSGSRRRLFREK
jgi:hypothetical protein